MEGVLKKQHEEMLRKLSQSCDQTREYLESCKGCFLDVEEEIAKNEEQARICEQIRKRAFPNAV